MSGIMLVYLVLLLVLASYLIILITRLLPLVIYVHQTLPFVPIPQPVAKAIAQLPAIQAAHNIIDLGCGTGTLLAALHRYAPNSQLAGVEFKPSLLRFAQWRSYVWKHKPTLIAGDMFQLNISNYDAVVGFWISRLTPQLADKFVVEAKPGCVIVSYLFPLPPRPALHEEVVTLGKHKIFVYRKALSY